MMTPPLNKTKTYKPLSPLLFLALALAVITFGAAQTYARATVDFPIVKLRSLDKITARTKVFEAEVGSTIKFGTVYIKAQACRKSPEFEQPESAAFLQIWEIPPVKQGEEEKAEWIFSGWMFASSPGLSAMDHPIYDVLVLDCLQTQAQRDALEAEEEETAMDGDMREGEGILEESEAPPAPVVDP